MYVKSMPKVLRNTRKGCQFKGLELDGFCDEYSKKTELMKNNP